MEYKELYDQVLPGMMNFMNVIQDQIPKEKQKETENLFLNLLPDLEKHSSKLRDSFLNMKEEDFENIPNKSPQQIREESKKLQSIQAFNQIFFMLIKKVTELTPKAKDYYDQLFTEITQLINRDSLLLVEFWKESIKDHIDHIGDMTKENQKYLLEHASDMGVIESLQIHIYMMDWPRNERKKVFEMLKGLKMLSSFYHNTGLEMMSSIENIAKKIVDPTLVQRARQDPFSVLPEFVATVPDLIMQDPQMMKNMGKMIKKLEQQTSPEESLAMPSSMLNTLQNFKLF